jgi:hypothetical protein
MSPRRKIGRQLYTTCRANSPAVAARIVHILFYNPTLVYGVKSYPFGGAAFVADFQFNLEAAELRD